MSKLLVKVGNGNAVHYGYEKTWSVNGKEIETLNASCGAGVNHTGSAIWCSKITRWTKTEVVTCTRCIKAQPVEVAETIEVETEVTEAPVTDKNVELIEAVKRHAMKHYNKGAWDTIIEAHTDEEIAALIGKASTARGAIWKVGKALAPYASKRADIEATAF